MKYIIIKKQNEKELEDKNPVSFDDIIVCEERNGNIEMVMFDSNAEAGAYKVAHNISGVVSQIPTSELSNETEKEKFIKAMNELSEGADMSKIYGEKKPCHCEDSEPPACTERSRSDKGVGGLEINPTDIIADAHLYKVTDGFNMPGQIKYFIAKNGIGALKAWVGSNNIDSQPLYDKITIELVQMNFLENHMNLQTNFETEM